MIPNETNPFSPEYVSQIDFKHKALKKPPANQPPPRDSIAASEEGKRARLLKAKI